MNEECTKLFLHYREIARLVWNLGFWPNPKLRVWDAVGVYMELNARLFESMILLALGYQGRVEDKYSPGDVGDFRVRANREEVELLVDENLPDEPGHIWGEPVISLGSQSASYELKFVRFFDWDLLGIRDFRFLEVLIQRLDARPDLVGHHGLLEVEFCSIWFFDHKDEKEKAY